jgi:cytochrome c556
MIKRSLIILVLAWIGLALPVSAADKDPNLVLIKARQGEMDIRSMFATPLFMMARGKLPYDAEKAESYAKNLQALMKVDTGMAWAPGTGTDKYPETSHALPDVWSTYPAISEKGKKYAEAVNALAGAAGNGLDDLRSKVGDLGQGCKDCHDEFRQKE